MRKTAIGAGLLLALATLAVPATAQAADAVGKVRIVDGVLVYTAADGRVNDLFVWESIIQGGIVFEDRGNLTPGSGCWEASSNADHVVCDDPAGPGYAIEISMGDRNDSALVQVAYGATIRGGTGDDALAGTSADLILGNSGDDWLYGGDGYNFGNLDVHRGGPGNDYVEQGDRNYGGPGNDTILPNWGGRGYGEDGRDLLLGSGGDDRLYGNAGVDELRGGAGNDDLYGGSHNDALWGNSGNDLLDGGTGSDTLSGGPGTDTVRQ